MAIDPKTVEALQVRVKNLQSWLEEEAPYASADQRHLEEHTPERAYWHYGYLMALRDVLRVVEVKS